MAIGRVIEQNARQQDDSNRRRRMVAGAVINPVVSIAITTQPSNTQYANSPLDLTGMVIKATYRDGTEEDVTSKVICNRTSWGSAGVEQSATFGYNEKSCVLTVTPTAVTPTAVEVKTPPTKTAYKYGEEIDLAGCVLEVTYNNGSKADKTTGFTASPTTMGADTESITLTYTEGGVTLTTTQAVTLVAPASVTVKTAPTKTAYRYGESISLAGCVLEVTYDDSHKEDVAGTSDNVSVSPTTMGADTESVTITYTEGSNSVTTTQAVTLVEPESATIKTPADKLTYQANDELDMTGLTLEITYSDDSTAIVTEGFEGSPETILADTTEITVTYTEGDVSVTTGYEITVTE